MGKVSALEVLGELLRKSASRLGGWSLLNAESNHAI